jgi:Tol biopolymer transport system component
VVVVNGIEGKEYRRVSGRTQMVNAPPIFSPDSKRVAYYAEGGGKALIVVDAAEGKEYEGIGLDTLVFSPDSKRVAYLAQRSYEKWVAVVDGVEGKEYEEMVADTLVFSPDSQRVAYATGSAVVVDGVEKKEGGEIGSGTLLFSPDSQRLAYWVSRGKKVGGVVVDGVAGKEYERIAVATPVFSPDSKHMAYGALTGGKFLIVVDGVEGNERDFEGFFNVRDSFNVKGITLVFDSPTQFHAYALRGKAELVRVDVEIGTVAAEPSVPK